MKCIICEKEELSGLYYQGDFYCNFCIATTLDATDFYISTLLSLIGCFQNLTSSILEKLEYQSKLDRKDQVKQVKIAKRFVKKIVAMKERIYEYFN